MCKQLIISSIKLFYMSAVIAPLVELTHEWLDEAGVRVFLLREDTLHPAVSGNKWRKLQYNLQHAIGLGARTLVSFGGAHSNHIAALAAAGSMYGFVTVGFIRGEQTTDSPTIAFARRSGMDVRFVSRVAYQKLASGDVSDVAAMFPDAYIMPEGGANQLGVRGCMDIVLTHPELVDCIWCVACGTGTTMAGMVLGLSDAARRATSEVWGFSVLKGGFMATEVAKKIADFGEKSQDMLPNWHINDDYHFGGYAAYSADLVAFVTMFYERYGVLLDPIYTGKLLFGIFDLIRQKRVARGCTLVAVHTGGLQGIQGYNRRYATMLPTNG